MHFIFSAQPFVGGKTLSPDEDFIALGVDSVESMDIVGESDPAIHIPEKGAGRVAVRVIADAYFADRCVYCA